MISRARTTATLLKHNQSDELTEQALAAPEAAGLVENAGHGTCWLDAEPSGLREQKKREFSDQCKSKRRATAQKHDFETLQQTGRKR